MSSTDSSSEVILTLSPPRATITLNRPKRANSLSPQLQDLFLSYLDQISNDDLIHYLVLTGNGRFFCTGMDLGAGAGAAEGGDKDQIFDKAKSFFQRVEMFDKPSEYPFQGREKKYVEHWQNRESTSDVDGGRDG